MLDALIRALPALSYLLPPTTVGTKSIERCGMITAHQEYTLEWRNELRIVNIVLFFIFMSSLTVPIQITGKYKSRVTL